MTAKPQLKYFTAAVCASLVTILLAAVPGTVAFSGENMNVRVAKFWEVKYGLADESDEVTRRARVVFEKLFTAAGKPGVPGRRPERVLVIVDANSREMPLYALPDGHVVMGHRVARECFEGVPESTGNARLAYILGHELAHLALRHALTDNILMGLTQDAAARSYLEQQPKVGSPRLELHADDQGFLFAMLAGYRISPLIEPLNGYTSFWNWWDDRFGVGPTESHPESAARVEVLKQRAASVQRSVAWYDTGIRLSLSGHYAPARLLLDAYAEAFPSHDAFNALGVLHLREAVAAGAKLSRSMVMDADSQASLVSISANSTPHAQDKLNRSLQDAEEYFLHALKIAPDDLPATVNLVTTLQAMGLGREAEMEQERIRLQAPTEAARQALDALFSSEMPSETQAEKVAKNRVSPPHAFRERLDAIAQLWRSGPPAADAEPSDGWEALPLPASFDLEPMLATLRAKAFRAVDESALILFFEEIGKPATRQALAIVAPESSEAAVAEPYTLPSHTLRVLTADGSLYADAMGGIHVRDGHVADAWRIWRVQAQACMP